MAHIILDSRERSLLNAVLPAEETTIREQIAAGDTLRLSADAARRTVGALRAFVAKGGSFTAIASALAEQIQAKAA